MERRPMGAPIEGKLAEQRPAAFEESPKVAARPHSPIPDLIRQLDRLSALLRHYIAGFLKFRPAVDDCDDIFLLMTESASGFQHWNRVSQRLERVRPSTFEPPMLDGAWAEDVAPTLQRFNGAYKTIFEQVQIFQYDHEPEPPELSESQRLAGVMRSSIRAALDSCMSRADDLADEVRKCAEKITMLIGLEGADLVDQMPSPSGAKYREEPPPIENPSANVPEGAVVGAPMEPKPRPAPSPTSREGGVI